MAGRVLLVSLTTLALVFAAGLTQAYSYNAMAKKKVFEEVMFATALTLSSVILLLPVVITKFAMPQRPRVHWKIK